MNVRLEKHMLSGLLVLASLPHINERLTAIFNTRAWLLPRSRFLNYFNSYLFDRLGVLCMEPDDESVSK